MKQDLKNKNKRKRQKWQKVIKQGEIFETAWAFLLERGELKSCACRCDADVARSASISQERDKQNQTCSRNLKSMQQKTKIQANTNIT